MDTVLWSALADPNRRAILGQLLTGPRPVGELAEVCGLSQPSASKHLRVLRDAGLVRVQPDAQRRIYVIEPAPMAELDAWLAPYRRLWNRGLDALGRRLDAAADEREADSGADGGTTAPAPGAVLPGAPRASATQDTGRTTARETAQDQPKQGPPPGTPVRISRNTARNSTRQEKKGTDQP